jgi:F420-non-reducing hydrogenase iron-sulfur subunit
LAGVSRLQYATDIKLIRLMCTGRIDLAFILRAFSNGADGVFVGGCWPGECHYITEGNYIALSTVLLCKKIMEYIGLNPERLRLEWVSASEGMRFADVMNDFSKNLKEIGPLGNSEGLEEKALRFKLDILKNLVSYMKLVERERLRVPEKSEAAYTAFFSSDEFERLFRELIADKFEIGQMMVLLREKPRSTGEIAQMLGISPSEISRHLNSSARQGLLSFDESKNLIAAV